MPIILRFPYMLTLVLTFVSLCANASTALDFRCLDIQDGLADCHISNICKDKQGYIWVGTATGLSRYDGFRFKNFYNIPADTTSIKSNSIDEIQCAPNGDMWIRTDLGYSIYSAHNEKFTNNLIPWMRKHGIQGYKLERVFFDKQGNTWVVVNGIGIYFLQRILRQLTCSKPANTLLPTNRTKTLPTSYYATPTRDTPARRANRLCRTTS